MTFGDQLATYRFSTRDHLSQEKVAKKIEDELYKLKQIQKNVGLSPNRNARADGYPSDGTYSNWESNVHRIPGDDRLTLIAVVKVFYGCAGENGLKTLQQANDLLTIGGYSALSEEERDYIFQREDGHSPNHQPGPVIDISSSLEETEPIIVIEHPASQEPPPVSITIHPPQNESPAPIRVEVSSLQDNFKALIIIFLGILIVFVCAAMVVMAARSLPWDSLPGMVNSIISTAQSPAPPENSRVCKSPGGAAFFDVDASYHTSGKMGDTRDITISELDILTRFTYQTEGQGPHQWDWTYINRELNPEPAQFAGVMYLDPPNNWGELEEGGYDLRGFRQITWEARSVEGDVYTQFVIGGIVWQWDDINRDKVNSPYPDSMPRTSLGTKRLDNGWQSFSFDLSQLPEETLACMIGGFGWVISWGSNGVEINAARIGPIQAKTFIIELRNIRYEK